jgi:hypothetical protein
MMIQMTIRIQATILISTIEAIKSLVIGTNEYNGLSFTERYKSEEAP